MKTLQEIRAEEVQCNGPANVDGLIIHYLSMYCERMYLNNIEYIHEVTHERDHMISRLYKSADGFAYYNMINEVKCNYIENDYGIQDIIKHYYSNGTLPSNCFSNEIRFSKIENYTESIGREIELLEYHERESSLMVMYRGENSKADLIRLYNNNSTGTSEDLWYFDMDYSIFEYHDGVSFQIDCGDYNLDTNKIDEHYDNLIKFYTSFDYNDLRHRGFW